MFRFNLSLVRNVGAVLSASCALSCSVGVDDGSEPTAELTQAEGLLFSMPGIGGLNVLWAGVPNPSTGSELIVGDVDPNGISVDTGVIGTIATGKDTPAGPESETLVGYGDFNADGQTDLLFRTSLTSKLTIWFMEGHRVRSKLASSDNAVPVFSSGVAKAHIADINGDGISDIVWTGTVGSPPSLTFRTVKWIMQMGRVVPSNLLKSVSDSDAEVIAVGNFNGDLSTGPGGDFLGHADYLKRRTLGDGMVTFVDGVSGAETPIAAVPGSSGWVVKAVGDFNGDRYADALWYNVVSGQVSVWEGRSNGNMVPQGVLGTVPPSSGWTLVGTADVDGSVQARSDLVWQHKANRVTSIWRVIDSSHANFENPRPFAGNSIVGIMNMTRPLAPSDLTFSAPSGGTSTVVVKNNYDVVADAQIHVSNVNGGAVADFDGSFGKNAVNVPASALAGGASACLVANVSYHGRFSNLSPSVCGALP